MIRKARSAMPSLAMLRIAAAATLASLGATMLVGCSSSSDSDPTSDARVAESTHSVTHAHGETDVPKNPKRVVVLEPLELDTAVALNITPVGAAIPANVTSVPNYLDAGEIQTVGTVTDPDLEAIAALHPDLILGTEARHSNIYDSLNKLAPTVFMNTQADPWQNNVRLIGEALGKGVESEKLLNGYNERCLTIKNKLQTEGKTANLLRPMGDSSVRIYSPTSFSGSALECVGFSIPEQEWDGDGGIGRDVSYENLRDARADYVFIATNDVNDASTVPQPIRNDRASFPTVNLVDTNYWLSGVGPKGGQLVLDDIERLLAENSK